VVENKADVTKSGTETIDGVPAIALKNKQGSTLYVAADDARPLQVLSAGSSGGSTGVVKFDYPSQPFVAEAPAPSETVDLSQLGGN
jgi:hypothetical protein